MFTDYPQLVILVKGSNTYVARCRQNPAKLSRQTSTSRVRGSNTSKKGKLSPRCVILDTAQCLVQLSHHSWLMQGSSQSLAR